MQTITQDCGYMGTYGQRGVFEEDVKSHERYKLETRNS
jgi:hypothetical protein